MKSDELRRRPEAVRYFYLALSDSDMHTGTSYGGLKYVRDRHNVNRLWVSDIITGVVREVTEPVAEFMSRWRASYNDPEWDYWTEVDKEARKRAAAAKRTR